MDGIFLGQCSAFLAHLLNDCLGDGQHHPGSDVACRASAATNSLFLAS